MDMNSKGLLAIVLVATLAASAMIPLSGASNIQVVLNPNANEATVSAYINSSIAFSANESSFLGKVITEVFPHSSNITIKQTSINKGNLSFQVVNDSISNMESNASLKALSLGYSRTIANTTEGNNAVLFINTSLLIKATVSGIFSNNTASLKWRSFSSNNSLELNGSYVNNASFGGPYLTSSRTVNTLNFSVFSKSLSNWTRTYNAATNVTTFSMDAGTTVHFQLNGSLGVTGSNFSITYSLDPSYSISAPGYDSATADSIVIGNPPPSSPIAYYAVGAVLVGAAAVMLLIRRKGPNH